MELRGNTGKPRLRSLALAAGCLLALGATPVFAAAIGASQVSVLAVDVNVDEADGANNPLDEPEAFQEGTDEADGPNNDVDDVVIGAGVSATAAAAVVDPDEPDGANNPLDEPEAFQGGTDEADAQNGDGQN